MRKYNFLLIRRILLLLMIICAYFPARPTTCYVRHPSTFTGGTSPFDSWANAATNIQQALNDASSGGTVVVSNGVYTNGATITIPVQLTLRSANGAEVTAIDGEDAYTCLSNSSASTIDGFTFQNGYINYANGAGGMWNSYGSIVNCVISNNRAVSGSGGMLVLNTIMTNCTIIHNRSEGGLAAGIYLRNSSIMSNCFVIANTNENATTSRTGAGVRMFTSHMINCDIIANVSTGTDSRYALGGGVYLDSAYSCSITGGNIISNVSFGLGGGIQVRHTTSVLTVNNTTIAHNKSATVGGGLGIASGTLTLNDCIISNNTAEGTSGGGISISGADMVLLNGCKVVNNQSGVMGGGIYVQSDLGHLVTNCLIRGNTAGQAGGGIRLHGSNTVTHCTIESNSLTDTSAAAGAGIYAKPVSNDSSMPAGITPKIHSCVISGNTIPNSGWPVGGGIYAGPAVEIRQCLVFNNSITNSNPASNDKYGGGIYLSSNCIVESCTIASNSAFTGGGLYMESDDNVVYNNIVYFNHADSANNDVYAGGAGDFKHNCASDTIIGIGNITAPPAFVNMTEGNYRQQSRSVGINAGINLPWMTDALDLTGFPRIDRLSHVVDMGCYECIFRGTFFYYY